MRKSDTALKFAAAGALCLLLCLVPASLGAQPAAARWILGISKFYEVPAESLARAASPGFTFGEARELAKDARPAPLSAALPSLLWPALSPIPPRFAAQGSPLDTGPGGGKVAARTETTLASRGFDEAFPDIAADASPLKGLGGLIVGFYAKSGETLDCVLVLFLEDGETAASAGNAVWRGNVAGLDAMPAALLPGVCAMVAGREVGVVDLSPPGGGRANVTLEGASGDDSAEAIGSRVFAYREGNVKALVRAEGFETAERRIDEIKLGAYREESLAMVPSATGTKQGTQMAQASGILAWSQETKFKTADRKFRSALGRFLASIPVSALAFGIFYSIDEAYSRDAVGETTLYAGAAAAGLSLAFSAGFAVDTVVRLVDVMKASR